MKRKSSSVKTICCLLLHLFITGSAAALTMSGNEEKVYFIANCGQWTEQVKFMACVNGAIYYFTNDGYTCLIPEGDFAGLVDKQKQNFTIKTHKKSDHLKVKTVRWSLANSSNDVQISGVALLKLFPWR